MFPRPKENPATWSFSPHKHRIKPPSKNKCLNKKRPVKSSERWTGEKEFIIGSTEPSASCAGSSTVFADGSVSCVDDSMFCTDDSMSCVGIFADVADDSMFCVGGGWEWVSSATCGGGSVSSIGDQFQIKRRRLPELNSEPKRAAKATSERSVHHHAARDNTKPKSKAQDSSKARKRSGRCVMAVIRDLRGAINATTAKSQRRHRARHILTNQTGRFERSDPTTTPSTRKQGCLRSIRSPQPSPTAPAAIRSPSCLAVGWGVLIRSDLRSSRHPSLGWDGTQKALISA